MTLAEQLTSLIVGLNSTSFPGLIKRHAGIFQSLISATDKFNPKNINHRIWIVIHGEPPVCSQGNQLQFNTWTKGYRKGCILGNKCQCVGVIRMKGQRATLQQKYGVTTVNAIPGVNARREQTMIDRFGVPFAAQNADVMSKRTATVKNHSDAQRAARTLRARETFIQRYGVDHHMQTAASLDKQQATNIQRYGVARPMQSPEIAAKASATQRQHTQIQRQHKLSAQQQTLFTNHGVSAASRVGIAISALAILDDPTLFTEYASTRSREQVSTDLGIHMHTVYMYARKHNCQSVFQKPSMSKFEREVGDFFLGLGITTVSGDRSILAGRELDIWVPDHQLAVECSGLYWHSENSSGRTREYHATKFKSCWAQNINLVTIWEDQWNNQQIQIKNRILHMLKLSPRVASARQCTVKLIDNATAADFLQQHHLQGKSRAKINLGLFNNNQLVAVMTFGQPRFSTHADWELIRYACAGSVPGAARKLFAYFVNEYRPDSVLSYADNSWGPGNMYQTLGFDFVKSQTGYWYTDYHHRFNRMGYQKHKIVSLVPDGADKTEWQIAQELGLDRIWDCGQSTYQWSSKHK